MARPSYDDRSGSLGTEPKKADEPITWYYDSQIRTILNSLVNTNFYSLKQQIMEKAPKNMRKFNNVYEIIDIERK